METRAKTPNRSRDPELTDWEIEEIVKGALGGNYEAMVKGAQKLGKELKDLKLTTSQIRRVFGTVKKMEMDSLKENFQLDRLWLVLPRIFYASARPGATSGTRKVRTILDSSVNYIFETEDGEIQKKRFHSFCDFFEAILAYHRAYGGK